ncbi:MAG: FHA domain-containing protein, partial [Gammaproteobacteria bacterium]
YTNIPDAIERAVYELKNSDRPDSRKSIVFMTDGIVDTGNAARDQEKSRWLQEELVADAEDAGIAIFGIAFTEEADFQLIQSLAQKTNGEYYRALKPEDLNNVYERIHAQIIKAAEPPVVAPPPPEPPKAFEPPPPPPAPVIIEVPVQPQAPSKQEQMNTMLMIVALAVVIITVIFLVFMVMRSSRRKPAEEAVAQEAYLKDIHGYSSQPSHKLGSMPTMLGRTAGTDTDHMNYIVIPQTTIGRRHALIEYKEYAYWIVDQGSINGTFVNDTMISGETRLKHGDRIRLHKYEFEFSMPEMDEAGMTVVSHTVVGSGLAKANEMTVSKTSTPTPVEGTGTSGPDFDLGEMTSGHEMEEDTVLKGSKTGEEKGAVAEDETIMMDDDGTESSNTDATLRPDDHDSEDYTADQFKDKPD